MPLDLPTFYKRSVSALVFVIIMLAGMLWSDTAFLLLVCIINILCLREFFKLMEKIDKTEYWPAWLPFIIDVASLLMIVTCYFKWFNYLSLFLVLPAVFLVFSSIHTRQFLLAMVQSIIGLFYITVPMAMLLMMRMQITFIPFFLILLIWSNDTLAYLVGSFLGKHPFSPISPKKTWEGTLGGAFLTLTLAYIYGYFSHQFNLADSIMLALCATVAGTLGDLMESKLKRLADVKDSGNIMPGHGGALDRFDSLLIATPFAYVYFTFFMHH